MSATPRKIAGILVHAVLALLLTTGTAMARPNAASAILSIGATVENRCIVSAPVVPRASAPVQDASISERDHVSLRCALTVQPLTQVGNGVARVGVADPGELSALVQVARREGKNVVVLTMNF